MNLEAMLEVTRDRQIALLQTPTLAVTAMNRFDDTSWRQYCEIVAARQTRGRVAVSLAYVRYGGSRENRRVFQEYVDAGKIALPKRSAIITSSATVRATINTFAVFLRAHRLRAFREKELDLAFNWLEEDQAFDFDEARRACAIATAAVDMNRE
jgi:hypothetical protein